MQILQKLREIFGGNDVDIFIDIYICIWYNNIKIREGKLIKPERENSMTMTEIMTRELNNDLSLSHLWREKMLEAETEKEREYYRGCMLRSRHRAEAKEELIQSLGYTVLFSDEREECIAIYPMEFDD